MTTDKSNKEAIQLLNTAIIKSKDKKIDPSYESRLSSICDSESIKALSLAATYLSEQKSISRDQAAIELIETIRELDDIWTDYIMMEGIEKFKNLLKNHQN